MKRRGRPALTPWFPGNVKPARKGVYQRRYEKGGKNYSLWDGNCWLLGADDRNLANDPATYVSAEQRAPWRGRRYPAS